MCRVAGISAVCADYVSITAREHAATCTPMYRGLYNHAVYAEDSRRQGLLLTEKWLSLVAVCQADIRCSICFWLSTDRHHILAVAIWDIGVARRNDHAARCRQLRWGRRRRNHTDVGRDIPPSGGGNPSGTRRGRQPINIQFF